MATPLAVAGSKVWISDAAIASTVDTESEFLAVNWIQIGLVESVGEFGRIFETVPFADVATGRTYKLKGAYDDGTFDLTVAEDLADSGQSILADAADDMDQDHYGFRIELSNAPVAVGSGDLFFFRGLPLSYGTRMGGASAIFAAVARVAVNSDIIRVPAADLYDHFYTGGSLTHYNRYKGDDPQTLDFAISSNTLVGTIGDAGGAGDTVEIVGATGYTLSDGALTFEVKIKRTATPGAFYVGLTDNKDSLEIPIQGLNGTNTFTTNASDAVGFVTGTNLTTPNFWLVGVNNDIDETVQNSAIAPTGNVYRTLRIVINTSGDATFYIDGAQVGATMTTACRTSVPLYPVICGYSQAAATATLTADYLYVRQD